MILYIDNRTSSENTTNLTAPSLPKIMLRCSEDVNDEVFDSICLVENKASPADVMTKKNPNSTQEEVLKTNYHFVSVEHLFILQQSLYRHSSLIPTSKVIMVDDHKKYQPLISSSSQYSFHAAFLTLPPTLAHVFTSCYNTCAVQAN